jgi:hypothetical protein
MRRRRVADLTSSAVMAPAGFGCSGDGEPTFATAVNDV